MKKRCLSLLLALVMCLALLPATAFAADKAEIKWLPKGMEIQAYVPKTDRILAKNGSMWYLLDREGNIVQPLGRTGYDSVGIFYDGLAAVQTAVWPGGEFGYIDEDCNLVIPMTKYDGAFGFFEGLAAVLPQEGGPWGFIDKTGSMVIQPVYEHAGNFSEGLAPVHMGDYETGLSGYIDKTGKIVIPFEYNYADDFSDGLACVGKDGKYGYIDNTGKVVIPLQYEGMCGSFSDGRAVVFDNDTLGYIDKTGKMVFSYSNSSAEAGEFGYDIREFSEGLVEITGAGTRFVDVNGKVAFELDAKTSPVWMGFANGVMFVAVDDGADREKVGLIDKTGAYVIAPSDEYMMFSYTGSVVYAVKNDGTEGIVQLKANAEPAPAVTFTDLKPNAFYLEPVAWAVDKNITNGTTATTFSPNENCTHGQILTFLWRAAGSPASNATLPFATTGKEYYLGAAKWAYEKGMIGAGFDHKTPCTRADAVNYIWQAFGKQSASYDGRFTDIPANSPYATAVAWALANGVTTGATATTFNPTGICNRGQIVTFLYRAYSK